MPSGRPSASSALRPSLRAAGPLPERKAAGLLSYARAIASRHVGLNIINESSSVCFFFFFSLFPLFKSFFLLRIFPFYFWYLPWVTHYSLRLATQSSFKPRDFFSFSADLRFIRIATAIQRKHQKHRTWRGPIIEHTKKQAAFSTWIRDTKLHLGDCASAGSIRATFSTRL